VKTFFLLFIFLIAPLIFSQNQIDTSYTVHNTYKKEIKKFPFIKIVKNKNNINVESIKDLTYKKIDDRTLHFDAYLNKQKTISPAVIMIHGGGWSSGNKLQMSNLAQELALNGYSCFSIEYRLSLEAKYPAGINDVEDAIEFIKKNADKYKIDSNNIVILGCSSGAQMASLTGVKHGNEFKAIINLDGILAFHHPESKEGKSAANWLGGTYQEIPSIWEEASALNNVDKNCPPVLFINSQFERFHAGRDDMIKKLNKLNIYSKVEKIKDSPHSFWFFEPWFDEMVGYIVTFLDKKIKN
jgi:acetyl esterase/lipase